MIIAEFFCAGCHKKIDNPEEALVATTPGHPGLLATVHDDQACFLNFGAHHPNRRPASRRRLSKVSEWHADGLEVDPWGDRGLAKLIVNEPVAS